ncbi:MAG: YggS family pyridoxal phosphate-dependent enzyme [Sphaerochaeta sp.]|nr:YggS family pyridoxal phosphate-dependent enzyme [Sphaerochaeta sp.]
MTIQERLDDILKDLSSAAEKSGRLLSDIHLMAVSKYHPYDEILSLFRCNQNLFGENKVQEVMEKFPSLRPEGMQLHLIGHLQSNKVKKIVPLVDAIDSVDSLKLAQKINEASLAIGKVTPILLQFNTSEEENKSGFEDERSLYEALDTISDLSNISVQGLMTLGPLHGGEKEIRTAFAHLKNLQDVCTMRYPQLCFKTLSMGMSSDFPLAIAEGATQIRIGTRLFGPREYK